MTDAPPDLPGRHTILRSFAGHLEAGPDIVYQRLVAALTPASGGGARFHADPDRRFIVVQGGWWYRGEYRVLPEEQPGDEAGSIVRYEIINVARVMHWAGVWTAGSVLRAAPRAFQALLTGLAHA
jgi:hypothetical protein